MISAERIYGPGRAPRAGRFLVSESGTQAAILTGPGPFSVTLDWGGPVVSGQPRLLRGAGAARGQRARQPGGPGEQAEVRVDPGLIKRTAAAGKSPGGGHAKPGSGCSLLLVRPRHRHRGGSPRVRFLSDVKTLLTVGEADLQMAVLVRRRSSMASPRASTFRSLPASRSPGPRGHPRRHLRAAGRAGPDGARARQGGGTSSWSAWPAPRRTGPTRSTRPWLHSPAPNAKPARSRSRRGHAGAHRHRARHPETHGCERGLVLPALAGQGADPGRFPLPPAGWRGTGPEARRQTLPSASVLAAVADRAEVTTLATTEGRRLTEVTLTVRNHAQPFLRWRCPPGPPWCRPRWQETAKPVQGEDGTGCRCSGPASSLTVPTRCPLSTWSRALRSPRRARLNSGCPAWTSPSPCSPGELFLPDRYRVKKFEATPSRGRPWRRAISALPAGSRRRAGWAGWWMELNDSGVAWPGQWLRNGRHPTWSRGRRGATAPTVFRRCPPAATRSPPRSRAAKHGYQPESLSPADLSMNVGEPGETITSPLSRRSHPAPQWSYRAGDRAPPSGESARTRWPSRRPLRMSPTCSGGWPACCRCR